MVVRNDIKLLGVCFMVLTSSQPFKTKQTAPHLIVQFPDFEMGKQLRKGVAVGCPLEHLDCTQVLDIEKQICITWPVYYKRVQCMLDAL